MMLLARSRRTLQHQQSAAQEVRDRAAKTHAALQECRDNSGPTESGGAQARKVGG